MQQIDTSIEWYFARASSLTLSLFYKELENVLTNEVTSVPVTYGGETYDVRRPKPINSDETGKVKGFELAYQQFYDNLPGWLSGFGIQANNTYIDSKGVTQSVLGAG
jgi:outer membrane receptor protein involved in Fe transport